jgi:AcrR family transcriptional regulator
MTAASRGPRADRPDLREEILRAARERFGEAGFSGTSLRSIAALAGVDVSLIPYYFGNKSGLYAATLELQLDPRAKLAAVFSGGLDGVGERLASTILHLIDDEVTGPVFLSLIRSAVTEGAARDAVHTLVDDVILRAYVEHLDVPDARQRATLAATQIIGVAMARHVVPIEPIASMPVDELAALVGPTLQRYLAGG